MLAAQNNALRTRVSELEVINDLFKGRVSELEASEQEARREVEALKREVERLKRGSVEMEKGTDGVAEKEDEERATKKAKLNENHDNESGEAGFAEPKKGEETQAAPETTEK